MQSTENAYLHKLGGEILGPFPKSYLKTMLTSYPGALWVETADPVRPEYADAARALKLREVAGRMADALAKCVPIMRERECEFSESETADADVIAARNEHRQDIANCDTALAAWEAVK